jgi:probable F420-dependent oxidoreductase
VCYDPAVPTGVRIGVAIPQTILSGAFDARGLRGFLARAEALGFESAWVVEQILGSVKSLEPVTLLTYAAACTERIRLGSAVLLTALRSPVHLAKTLATLDHLSGGRIDVGVGLGGNPRIYPAFGLSAERRAARFAEGLSVMKRLWTEERVSLDGEFFKLRNASMEPKPLQKPHPPLWFGGHHPNALRRSVELGDAFIGAGSISTKGFLDEVKILRALIKESGRDAGRFPLGKRVYIAVDRDRARAGRRLEEWFKAFYGRPELAAEVSVWGEPQECVERLSEIVEAGVGFLMLNPVFDELEQLELFASALAPKL